MAVGTIDAQRHGEAELHDPQKASSGDTLVVLDVVEDLDGRLLLLSGNEPLQVGQGGCLVERRCGGRVAYLCGGRTRQAQCQQRRYTDRKSTRLNSSHGYISYAVFCLKKKNK